MRVERRDQVRLREAVEDDACLRDDVLGRVVRCETTCEARRELRAALEDRDEVCHQLPRYEVMPYRESSRGTWVWPSPSSTSSVTCAKNASFAYSRVSNTMRYVPGSRSRPSSLMRPSASVFALAMTRPSRCVSSRTRTPVAGLPVVVSRTCVETDVIGVVSYVRDADGPHHGGEVRLQSASRGREGTEDVRGDPRDPSISQQARARALERRVHLGADGRSAHRHRVREPHLVSRAGPGARLSGWH